MGGTIMRKLLRVIGETENGLNVVGVFLFAKTFKKKTTYYVQNSDGEVIPCVKCVEDVPKFR